MDVIAETPLAGKADKIKMKIESQGDHYNFYYAMKSGKWVKLKGELDAKYLSTRNAGGFTGCLYAMYATSSGVPSDNIATYKYLRYSGNDPVYR